MRLIVRLVLKLMGWKIVGAYPSQYKKSIVIEAPHTSMWDFIIGWMAFYSLKVRVRFLIKKELFFFPLGIIIKAMGAIPVDRGKRNNMVDYVVSLFDNYEELVVTITPEGTRKKTTHWKKGFWYIAMKAKLPIIVGYLDYKKKEGGVGFVMWPSGNFEEDFKKIEDFYRDKTAKHPEKFNLTNTKSELPV